MNIAINFNLNCLGDEELSALLNAVGCDWQAWPTCHFTHWLADKLAFECNRRDWNARPMKHPYPTQQMSIVSSWREGEAARALSILRDQTQNQHPAAVSQLLNELKDAFTSMYASYVIDRNV